MKCKNCGAKVNKKIQFCGNCGCEISKKKNNKITKKARAVIACVCCLVVIISGTIGGFYLKNKSNTVGNDADNSNYVMLNEGFTDVKVTDEDSALAAINDVKDIIGINDVNTELKTQRVDTIDETTYYRFQQYYNDIPVCGKNINMPVYADGKVAGLTSNYYVLNNDLPTETMASNADIEKSLKKHFDNKDIILEQLDDSQLVYYITEDNKAVLVYELNDSVAGYTVFVDAISGEIISSNSLFSYESAEVQSEDGEVKAIGWMNEDGSYHLYNDEHKISVFDFSSIKEVSEEWNFKDLGIDTIYSPDNKFDKKAVQLMNYLCVFDDYFKNLGDVGFYQIHAAVNDCIGTNARAGGTFDRGGTNLRFGALMVGIDRNMNDVDIIAHEYTHMVSKSLLDLDGMEASAINEGFSDIFGEILQEYLYGEIDWKHDGRNLADPENKKNEQCYPASVEYLEKAKKNGDNYYIKGNYLFGGEVEDFSHFASTIISHTAYLMWNGIDDEKSKKISTDELAKLWYNSLFLMPSNPIFSSCRNAVELSARIMMNNSQLTSEQYSCIKEAFDMVGIDKASYTYKDTVKNDFDLKVLNSKGTDDLTFNYKIYDFSDNSKRFTKFFEFVKKDYEDFKIDEGTLSKGEKRLSISDGLYCIELTETDTNEQSEPIFCRIVVDGSNDNSVDEVVIRTDFDDVTTVVLNKEEDKLPDEVFGDYIFSSGAGAWSTELTINSDLSFSGVYQNTDNDEIVICEFTGNFSDVNQVDDYTYKMTLETLTSKYEEGYTYKENNITYECVEQPYGINDGKEFYVYLKGREAKDLSEEFLVWINSGYIENANDLPLSYTCIRNTKYDYGFVKYDNENLNISDIINEAGLFAWNWFYNNSHTDKSQVVNQYNKEWNTNINYELISETSVNSKNDLIELTKRHFNENTTNELMSLKMWLEKDNRLYVSQTEGIGDWLVDKYDVVVKKESATKYILQITGYSGEEIIAPQHDVYLEYVGGYWVLNEIFAFGSKIEITVLDSSEKESISEIHSNDIITVTGKLKTEKYEINSENSGVAIILDLENPIKYKLYDDFLGYNGEEYTIDSLQISINESEYKLYKDKTITVSGNVIFAHTGHHQRQIVLNNCVIK